MKKIELKSILPININPRIRKYIQDVNKLIDKNLSNPKKYSEKILIKKLFKIQQDINNKLGNKIIFNLLNKDLKKIFQSNNYAVSDFILRYVNKSQKKIKPIILHQEKFYGDKTWNKIYNLWIPIRNNNKNNSIKFVKNSNKFIEGKEFKIIEKKTNIKKKSYAHKLGALYNEKRIHFLKKVKIENLFFKNKVIIFDGNLMHGNGINKNEMPRISIDLRFMNKKYLKKNHKSGSTNKKYFSIISLK